MTQKEVSVDDLEKTHDEDHKILSVSEFLSKNHQLFAVVGVLAALAVYLRDFRGDIAGPWVQYGIVSALLMFVIGALSILSNIIDQIKWTEKADLDRVVSYSVLIIGVSGLSVSIFMISLEFYAQFVQLIDYIIGFGIFIGYMSEFPWGKYRGIDGLSDKAKKRIEDAPNTAMSFAVIVILFSSSQLGSLVNIANYDQPILFPTVIAAIISHYLISDFIRKLTISRSSS